MNKQKEKEMKKYLLGLDNNALVDLYLQKDFELKIAENHIDNLELQLREQYQLVDEKDRQLKKYKNSLKEHKIVKYEMTKDDVKLAIDEISNMELYNEMFKQIKKEIYDYARQKAADTNKTMGQIYAEITGNMSMFGLDLKKEKKRHDKSRMVIDIKTE